MTPTMDMTKYIYKYGTDNMIISNINNNDKTLRLPEPINKLLDIFKSTNFADMEPGKYDVEGDDLFYVVAKYKGKDKEEVQFESHKKYIDLQFIYSGSELMGFDKYDENLAIITPYDDKKDVMFYETPRHPMYLSCNAGDFVLFSGFDLHAPGISKIGQEDLDIIKVVGKIHIDLL